MEPKTRKEHYLAKIAGEDVSVPEPKTSQEHYLKEIAENGVGSGGATSLADLSDVEINENSIVTENLLRFNNETNKWENVHVDVALLGWFHGGLPGVLTMNDVGNVFVSSVISIDISDTIGRMVLQLLQAAIAYGQYKADNLDQNVFRPLVNSAITATAHNANLSCAVVSDNLLVHCFQLVGATADFAVWSGVILEDVKFYRITFAIVSPDDTTPASIVVKAEELMTFTEPT